MVSWAQKAAQPPLEAASEPDLGLANKTVAVVDANAIISMGSSVVSLANVLITTEDILAEVRDPSSRRALELLPIESRVPTASAISSVAAFARKTGDIHQLSTEDIRLLALTYMLETGLHGHQHIRSEPAPLITHAHHTPKGGLPGWGTNGNSEEWDAIDAVEGADGESAAEPRDSECSGADTALQARALVTAQPEGWEIAKTSRNSLRRAKRKVAQASFGMQSRLRQQPDGALLAADAMCSLNVAEKPTQTDNTKDASTGSHKEAVTMEESSTEPSAVVDCGSHCRPVPLSTADQECSETDGSGEKGRADSRGKGAESPTCAEMGDEQECCSEGELGMPEPGAQAPKGFESNVSLVTSDFAMQNVALQMGLRLESKGGLRITRVQRSLLRCDGCQAICKSATKVFCPKCGHPTLSSILVTVGPDGVEQFGVRRKTILRGTRRSATLPCRFPLPKPKGGRNASNPILSEDVYRAKVRQPCKGKPASADVLDEPNFGELKKHANQPSHVSQGLSYLHTNWHNNPNERKAIRRSNRRR